MCKTSCFILELNFCSSQILAILVFQNSSQILALDYGIDHMSLNEELYKSGALEALAYFDVFDFPLSKQEILKYSRFPNLCALDNELNALISDELIFEVGGFFSIRNEVSLAKKRNESASRAHQYHFQAQKKSKLISKFPYVRGVFISGSLSKGVMHEDGDIDFFIVTSPNRLWVARTLLILYKKVFLLNSRKYFCINYLVDKNSLDIDQKNRFTAVELLSLLPMVNEEMHQNIIRSNSWLEKYFSGHFHQNPEIQPLNKYRLKSFLEAVLNGSLGNVLDDFFMNITLKRWRNKFGNMPEKDFQIALKTTKQVSKHHPSHFQKKVLKAYEKRMELIRIKVSNLPQTVSESA